MDDLVKNGTIYSSIMPNKKSIRATVLIGGIIAAVFAIPGIILLIKGTMTGGLIMLAMSVVCLAIIPFMVKSEKAKQAYMARRYAHFTENDFLNLENELYTAKKMYDTFYMLNEYLFAPDEGILLPYKDIRSIRTVKETTKMSTSGVTIVFCCDDGEIPVMVSDWRSYLNQASLFERQLNEKKDGRQVRADWR